MKKAIELNPFSSDKFVWTDIGCLRTSDNSIIEKIKKYPIYENISNDQIDIVLLNPIQNYQQLYFLNESHFAGSAFGGHRDTILLFHDLFYNRLNIFIEMGLFVGCDQQTISSVYNENRHLFRCIDTIDPWPNDMWDKEGDNNWFYMWKFYSYCGSYTSLTSRSESTGTSL